MSDGAVWQQGYWSTLIELMACLSGFEYDPLEKVHPYKFPVLLVVS